jgi:hypothetical protein
LAIIVAALILALYGPCNNSAAFKKIAALFQAIFAQAVLDSNAFAMAFQYEIFQQDDKYLRYVYGRGDDVFCISSSNLLPIYRGTSILEFHILV